MRKALAGGRAASWALAFAGATMTPFGASAQAKCAIEQNSFSVANGQTNRASARTDGAACEWIYWGGATNIYESIRFVAHPAHGRLSRYTPAGFRYHPKPTYHGKDSFTVKVCGRTQGVPGCSTIIYDVTVE
ncbi:MAG: Ig-like domain-containing protein [Rhodoblastus sp.]|nr:MAG: Ig-like domain-containing protein [Rhodoblastus sp.]